MMKMGIKKKSCLFWIGVLLLLLNPKIALGGDAMEISSPAFKDGEKIPMPYVMPGKYHSLTWKNVPASTKSHLSIVDPHPVAQS
jgi:phosphatidylethanolamine-binding protein (PEBP) family uncharacterized protein